MLGILTDDPEDTSAFNNLAFRTDFSNRALDLHRFLPFVPIAIHPAMAPSRLSGISVGENASPSAPRRPPFSVLPGHVS